MTAEEFEDKRQKTQPIDAKKVGLIQRTLQNLIKIRLAQLEEIEDRGGLCPELLEEKTVLESLL